MATSWLMKLSSGQLTPLNFLDSSDKSSLRSGELQLWAMQLIPLQQSSYVRAYSCPNKHPVFAFLVILGISFVNEIFEQICVA